MVLIWRSSVCSIHFDFSLSVKQGEVRQIKESFPTNLHTLGPALKSFCRGDSGNKLVLPVLPFRQEGADYFSKLQWREASAICNHIASQVGI